MEGEGTPSSPIRRSNAGERWAASGERHRVTVAWNGPDSPGRHMSFRIEAPTHHGRRLAQLWRPRGHGVRVDDEE